MLGMGLTLSFDDFRDVANLPKAGVIGVFCQFVIMPLLGWGIGKMLALDEIDPMLAVGLILVACCPGGTASNVVAFLARANIALSVMMTVVSTFAAILLTPLLTKWYAGTLVDVDAVGLFQSTVKVVLVPVTLGLILNQFLPKFGKAVRPFSPFVSVAAIVLIVASIIGQQREVILGSGWRLLAAPMLLHLGGFGLGYLVAKLFRLREENARTISIEVGMQNSGLGVSMNALVSLHLMNEIPSLIVVSWRGEGGKDAPEHIIMGEIMQSYFDMIGVPWRVLGPDIRKQRMYPDRMTSQPRSRRGPIA